jgi:hypothetical protein
LIYLKTINFDALYLDTAEEIYCKIINVFVFIIRIIHWSPQLLPFTTHYPVSLMSPIALVYHSISRKARRTIMKTSMGWMFSFSRGAIAAGVSGANCPAVKRKQVNDITTSPTAS